MRKAMLFGPADMRVVEVPQPTPGEGQVTVRVVRSSPYGTDVELYLARDARHRPEYPTGLGADFSGTIEDLGPGVTGFAHGDRVVAMALYHCGKCRYCLAGRTNLCSANPGGNFSRQQCFEDVALVPANKLAHLPDSVSFEDGAMLGGIMTGLNAAEKLQIAPGDRCAIIGAGGMGAAQVPLGKHLGAEVTVIGHGSVRLDICQRLAADHLVDDASYGENVLEAIRAVSPDGFEHVIETTCSDWGIRLSLEIAARGGKIAWIGGPPLEMSPWALVARELSLFAIHAGHHQLQALALLADGAIDLKPSITGRISLEELPAAMQELAGPNRGQIGRVMIEHDGARA